MNGGEPEPAGFAGNEAMKVVLELQDQTANIRKITVRHDIVIGRGSDCNLRLSSPQVSRRHCFLRVGRDAASVTDLDSSNGTYLDGKRLQSGKRFDLTDGAMLSVGPIRFLVRVRPELVSGAILSEPQLNDSINTESPSGDRSGSTIIEAGQRVAAKSDIDETSAGPVMIHTSLPDESFSASLDSELEIVDLGKRANEQFASQKLEAETAAAAKPALPEIDAVEVADAIEVVEEIEVVDVEVIEDDVEVEVVEEVVAADDDDLEFIDEGAVEVLEVDEAPASDWLTGDGEESPKKKKPAAKNQQDDFGDELDQFLKGLK